MSLSDKARKAIQGAGTAAGLAAAVGSSGMAADALQGDQSGAASQAQDTAKTRARETEAEVARNARGGTRDQGNHKSGSSGR